MFTGTNCAFRYTIPMLGLFCGQQSTIGKLCMALDKLRSLQMARPNVRHV